MKPRSKLDAQNRSSKTTLKYCIKNAKSININFIAEIETLNHQLNFRKSFKLDKI